jgi:hypothetical protein
VVVDRKNVRAMAAFEHEEKCKATYGSAKSATTAK